MASLVFGAYDTSGDGSVAFGRKIAQTFTIPSGYLLRELSLSFFNNSGNGPVKVEVYAGTPLNPGSLLFSQLTTISVADYTNQTAGNLVLNQHRGYVLKFNLAAALPAPGVNLYYFSFEPQIGSSSFGYDFTANEYAAGNMYLVNGGTTSAVPSQDLSFEIKATNFPTVSIESDKSGLIAGQTATLTFSLSESSNDFVLGDIAVIGGTLSNFSGSGTTYTATFTPTANSMSNGVVSVSSNKFSDAAGNFNVDGSDANNTITLTVNTLASSLPVCFARGTLIQTTSGPVPVEELQVNDRLSFYVEPTSSDCATVKWIGRQTFHPAMAELVDYLPIKLSASALGPGQPFEDLYVSPDHAILFDGSLIHAKVLINGTSILQMPDWEGNVEYFHIETENHELIYANGVPAETFIDNVSRRQFDNYAEFEALYPSTPLMTELEIPRVLFRRQLAMQTLHRLNALEEVWDARYRPTDVATESV